MIPNHGSPVLHFLRQMIGPPSGDDGSDEELLNRFVRQHDEAAFEVWLRRHGPMVLGVCRRVLRHAQDAEDAFEATLVRAFFAFGPPPRSSLIPFSVEYNHQTFQRARSYHFWRGTKDGNGFGQRA
jgi:hypothetical protein